MLISKINENLARFQANKTENPNKDAQEKSENCDQTDLGLGLWRALTKSCVKDFEWASQEALGDPAPLAQSTQSPKEEDCLVSVYLV